MNLNRSHGSHKVGRAAGIALRPAPEGNNPNFLAAAKSRQPGPARDQRTCEAKL
jgi:hypothetical protein